MAGAPRNFVLAAANAVDALTIIVTLGKGGASAAQRGELFSVEAPLVRAIETTERVTPLQVHLLLYSMQTLRSTKR